MKTLTTQRRLHGMLALMGTWQTTALAASCIQSSTCITIDGKGSGAMSAEEARQSKEQWNETQALRYKVNTRVEKEFDKTDHAVDEDRCNDSANVNTYWEPETRKCLDRQTGHRINH
ncbi:DUF1283 family protein [Serratia symbiotica]|uniref:DUF1283 family protein n=1 Tax=Serratia symbiotica TaxID=138074 RepID=UPI001DC93F6D|nr:DUF1283 family protein [Serratia symbiotica]NIG88424.1 DUF1283 family protein [Serratia symbiotica]USS94853.1 DUF1283 family protein [Serratia symbiotica]